MVSASTALHANSLAKAIFASVAPKSVGSGFRVGDDWQAPSNVRRNTILREGITLAQVTTYAAGIERGMKFLKGDVAQISKSPERSKLLKAMHKVGLGSIAEDMAQKGEKGLLVSGLRKLERNEPLFLITLACTSNAIAESVSRKFFPRNIWKKPESKGMEKRPERTPIPATLLDESKNIPIPVEIEICEIMPTRHSKNGPKFEASAKPQPVPFTSRPLVPQASFQIFRQTPPAVNPFQGRVSSPPVTRPDFSV